PLTVIKEFTSIIRDGLAGPITDEQREYLEIIGNRADDLGHMVDNMVDTSRIETGHLVVCRRRCSVREIVDRVRATLERKATARKVAVNILLQENLPLVFCDPEKIGRVIVNLTLNAFKTIKEGQLITIWSSHDTNAAEVKIGVIDHGPGFTPEGLDRPF